MILLAFCEFKLDQLCISLDMRGGGGGVGRSVNCHFPVPGNPGFCPMFVGSCLSAFFRLHKIAQCYVISFYSTLRNFPLFLPQSATLGIPLPATSTHVSRAPLALCPPGLQPLPPPLTGYLSEDFQFSSENVTEITACFKFSLISSIWRLRFLRVETRFLVYSQ